MDPMGALSDQLAAVDLTSSPTLGGGDRESGGCDARVQELEAQLRRCQEALEQYRTMCAETARADCVEGQPFYFMRSLFQCERRRPRAAPLCGEHRPLLLPQGTGHTLIHANVGHNAATWAPKW